MIQRASSSDRHPAANIRDARGRKFPAPAIYTTYPSGIHGYTGTARHQDVEVVFETRMRYRIRAIADDTVIANPTRTIKKGESVLVSKLSITFKEIEEMKRTHMHEMKEVSVAGNEGHLPMADLRVRVDMEAIGKALAAKAMKIKGRRAILLGGAVTVEAFNIRTTLPAQPPAGES